MTDTAPIDHTYEGMFLLEYQNSNPNGDLNAGGDPRMDPIDGRAWATGEMVRRQIRDYWSEKFQCTPPNDILMRSGEWLQREDGGNLTIDDMVQRSRERAGMGQNEGYQRGMEAGKSGKNGKKSAKKKSKKSSKDDKAGDKGLNTSQRRDLRAAICRDYLDARCFGFLGNVGADKVDSVKMPITVFDGHSLHPVVDMHVSNTRRILTNEGETSVRGRTVGSRVVLRYALMCHKFTICPASAKVSSMTMSDIHEFWEALVQCWVMKAAAHRRALLRGLWIFKQPLRGRRPIGYDWDDVIEVRCNLAEPIEASKFSDFEVVRHDDRLPPGVDVIELPELVEMLGLHDPVVEAAE